MIFHDIRAARVITFLLTLGVSALVSGQSEIYKWTDEHGHMHYADRAPSSESSEKMEQQVPNIMRSQRDDLWSFDFDGREWMLGYEATTTDTALREYVLAEQSIEDWTELVTSQLIKTELSPEEYFDRVYKANTDCPSLSVSKIHEATGTIILEGKHGACGGWEPGGFIQRLSSTNGDVLSLTFAQKGQVTDRNRVNWTRILEGATKKFQFSLEKKTEAKSLPLNELGPLPENTVSNYLETLGTGFTQNSKTPNLSRFTIRLQFKRSMPRGAFIEVHFPNPEDLERKDVVSKVIKAGEKSDVFMSQEYEGIKCWNYEILVYVYRDKARTELLNVHRQIDQSRINYSRIKTLEDLVTANLQGGRCP